MVPPVNKKRRPNKKKSDLEETYPDYLMQAFFSEKLLASASSDPGPAGTTAGTDALTGKKRKRKPSITAAAAGPLIEGRSGVRSLSMVSSELCLPGEPGSFRKMVIWCFSS